ncbi:MarR family transcriptional regulator [Ferrovibrio sp.]|uniref:MarR family winged helix-turn-helix transcriptional regulator n=1 Tax=Ferrovibrio sp. TaxID=1917215 RepID=UPI0025BFB066|nr:MarR family transcriptional regulator [Ferrovibrio sp.]MBX3452954.1 MarR family transcriptional regulator [Ferrovibrio sp.]
MARRLGRRVTLLYERHMAPFGLSIGQFSLLGMALALPDSRLSTLAEALDIDRTTISRNLAGLLQAGLAELRQGDDRRQRLVRATPAGRVLWRQALAGWRIAQDEARRQMQDFDRLLIALEKAGDALPGPASG